MTPLKNFDQLYFLKSLLLDLPGMLSRQYQSPEKIALYQLNLLKKRLMDAKKNVPLYQEMHLPESDDIQTLSDWKKIPVLTKKMLVDNLEDHHLNKQYSHNYLIKSKTSGSSGKVLNIYYDRNSFFIFVLAYLRLHMMNIRYFPWYKQTYIYTSPYPFNSIFGLYPTSFISTLTPISSILQQLRENPPDVLVCYPSHLCAIVEEMTTEDFKLIRPKIININSEMTCRDQRKYLETKLNTFIFDEYSSEELTRIASQCREKNYHIFDDINYLEILDDNNNPLPPGRIGNIVGTNLHNRAMPLLRYSQGDMGSIRESNCACGKKFRILENLVGRKNDSFVLEDGKRISSGFLLDLTYEILLRFENAVSAFCLIQEQMNVWIFEIVKGSNWDNSLSEKIKIEFLKSLGQPEIKLELKLVNEVTHTSLGKRNPIISHIAH